MRKTAIALLSTGFVFCTATAGASPLDDIIQSTFRPGIVKIDVSSLTPAFDETGNNICKSQGTGFLVSASHVITAEHVYTLDRKCGERIIVVKSATFGIQRIAKVVADKNDVGLLKVDSDFPPQMCALVIMPNDVFGTDAIRFGIPGLLEEPGPAEPVTIGTLTTQFAPLVALRPAFAEPGESGGPVVVYFNVVGITRSKLVGVNGYSFMTAASAVRALMAANPIKPAENECSPVRRTMLSNFDIGGTSGSILGGKPLSGGIFASVKVDDKFNAQISSIAPDIFKNLGKKFDSKTLTVNSDNINDVTIQGKFNSIQEHAEVANKAARTAADISREAREKLWNSYVAEGKKAGKWQDNPVGAR